MKCRYVFALAPLLLFLPSTGIAQVPSGEFTYMFTTAPSLWDLTGSYTNVNEAGTDGLTVDIQQQANGQLNGNRTEVYVNGSDYAEGHGSVSGRMYVKGGAVGARVSSIGNLTGVSGGVSYVANFKTKGTLVLTPSSLMLFSSGTVKVCVVGGKCVTSTSGADLSLPESMDGSWMLDTNIAADGNKLTGNGTITLSNGRVLTYLITGSYKPTTQVAKLKLVGDGEATGTSLSLTTQGTGMDMIGLKGRVLGQKPKFP